MKNVYWLDLLSFSFFFYTFHRSTYHLKTHRRPTERKEKSTFQRASSSASRYIKSSRWWWYNVFRQQNHEVWVWTASLVQISSYGPFTWDAACAALRSETHSFLTLAPRKRPIETKLRIALSSTTQWTKTFCAYPRLRVAWKSEAFLYTSRCYVMWYILYMVKIH